MQWFSPGGKRIIRFSQECMQETKKMTENGPGGKKDKIVKMGGNYTISINYSQGTQWLFEIIFKMRLFVSIIN